MFYVTQQVSSEGRTGLQIKSCALAPISMPSWGSFLLLSFYDFRQTLNVRASEPLQKCMAHNEMFLYFVFRYHSIDVVYKTKEDRVTDLFENNSIFYW